MSYISDICIYVNIDIENQRETESVALISTCKKGSSTEGQLIILASKKTEEGPQAATSQAQ